jgi:hypothetical protein
MKLVYDRLMILGYADCTYTRKAFTHQTGDWLGVSGLRFRRRGVGILVGLLHGRGHDTIHWRLSEHRRNKHHFLGSRLRPRVQAAPFGATPALSSESRPTKPAFNRLQANRKIERFHRTLARGRAFSRRYNSETAAQRSAQWVATPRRGQLDCPRLTTRLIATATTKVPKK